MKYTQPHLVIFQNPDGTWGHNGDLDRYLGIKKRPDAGSSSQAPHPMDYYGKYKLYKEKFTKCMKVREELRMTNWDAARTLENAINNAYVGLPFEIGDDDHYQSPQRHHVVVHHHTNQPNAATHEPAVASPTEEENVKPVEYAWRRGKKASSSEPRRPRGRPPKRGRTGTKLLGIEKGFPLGRS